MKFLLILLFLVIISYGQLLGMHVWQDDNALFFKLAHIEEKAGYLSAGPFGSGPYKYIVTPYIPIYNLFGHSTVPYFVFMILLYFVSVLVVYKVASKILGKVAGKVAAILYAAGYIASDGFIRIFNSAATSVSVIAISLLTFFYLTFFRKRQAKWYFFSLLFYFLSVELARGRSHYLISIILLFEVLFFKFSRPLAKGLVSPLVRLMPFVFIFYKYFVENADTRSANVGKFITSIASGGFYQIFGFLSSSANLFVPDWLTGFIFKNFSPRIVLVFLLIVTFIALVSILKGKRWMQIIFCLVFFTWAFFAQEIFNVIQIVPSQNQVTLAFLGGGMLLILLSLAFVLERKYVKIYLLFGLWALINILAYSAYNPLVVYESINRYLAHSFFVVVLLLGVVFVGIKPKGLRIIVRFIIIIWGVGNLVASVVYQRAVVVNRSIPAREFYEQLKTFVPKVDKGDTFYFDVAATDRSYFNDAFSVASMPETTAIAWRYRVDRYDIKLFTSFDELSSQVNEGEVDPSRLHAFWYSGKKLSDTTPIVRDYLLSDLPGKKVSFDSPISSKAILTKEKGKTYWENKEIVIDLEDAIVSFIPIEITFDIEAAYPDFDASDFPLIAKNSTTKKAPEPLFLQSALLYSRQKDVLKLAKFEASSFWRERKTENLNDSDVSTVWQPDRIKFREKNEWFQVDLGRVRRVTKLVWINGFGNNTPTKYKVEVSKDGKGWTTVKEINSIERIDDKTPRVITFAPVDAGFVRMTILESLNNDSPGIAEAWVVSADFEGLDIVAAENFLSSPFSNVSGVDTFNILGNFLGRKGRMKIYWQNDGSDSWVTTETSYIILIYDGSFRKYSIIIPPGGETIKRIRLGGFTAPSDIIVSGLGVRWPRR